jgi:hypothetical protein
MAPSDTMANSDPQNEANGRDAFHRYPDLPFELRAQICDFSIEAANPSVGDRKGISSCAPFALVSK